MPSPEHRLAELGITLPTPAAPVATYVGFVINGKLLVISGQLCFGADGKLVSTGKLGMGVSVDAAKTAARWSAINVLAQIKAARPVLGSVQITTAAGDRHLIKYLADPAATADRITRPQ